MTTYKTGNPIGSKDPKDLYDNAENLDEAVNNRSTDYWVDRLGVSRLTWEGMTRLSNLGMAVEAAERAEAAADAAFVNAEVYDEIAAGLASGDEQFQVVSGLEIVRYRNESGSAVEVARYPSSYYLSSELAYINNKVSTKETIVYDFHKFAGGPNVILLNDDGFIVNLMQSSSKIVDFFSSANQKSFILVNEDGYMLDVGSSGNRILVEDGGFVQNMGSENLYRDGNSIFQSLSDIPDSYSLSYEDFGLTSSEMYGKFDILMSEFPDLMSKRLIGKSVEGRDIYEYTISPVDYRFGTTITEEEINIVKPKIIAMFACTHGNEYAATAGLFVWVENLLKRWTEMDLYDVHRFKYQFKFVPCVNPDGMEIKQRNNANDIDLNRNFKSEGNDQPETVAMKAWFNETDAELFLDLHEHGENQLMWFGAYNEESFELIHRMTPEIISYCFRNLNLANYVNADQTTMVFISSSSDGTAVNYISSVEDKNAILIESPFRTHAMIVNRTESLRHFTASAISIAINSLKEN